MRRLLREWRWQRLKSPLAELKLLVLDVDGVLTDGGLWLDAEGRLQKRFDVRDGLGLKLLQKQGIQLAFSAVAMAAPRTCEHANWELTTAWWESRTNHPH